MKFCIFTKQIHVEKIVNFLNTTDLDYLITTERYETPAYDYDIGISYCWPYIVKVDYDYKNGVLIPANPSPIWYNYHPAPLPEYPGIVCYSKPLKDHVQSFGVTLHVLTNELDAGPKLAEFTFPLRSVPVHTNELGNIAHYYLFQLFKETVECLKFKPKSADEFKECGGEVYTILDGEGL